MPADPLPEAQPPHHEDAKRPDAELLRLRELLLGPTSGEVARIRDRLESTSQRTDDVSVVLPEAIRRRSRRDSELDTALMPTVEEAIKVSVRRNPKVLADAIFPALGPAIRKAIAQALSGMIQALDRGLEQRFSWKALKWRWEAMRTGVPFGQVVLRHTLVYRVEQVFLIHRETGLLLQHVAADDALANDGDMISAMLTAIQDFVADSFGVTKGPGLQTFSVGELVVRVEQGPEAVLAAVIRGHAPNALRTALQGAVEEVHLQYSEELAGFEGETSPFEGTRPILDACLLTQEAERGERRRSVAWVAIPVILLLLLGWWVVATFRANQRWSAYLDRLAAEPGLVVVNAEREGGKWVVDGLRDPLAADPDSLRALGGLARDELVADWEPYLSFHPAFVVARAADALDRPATVSLRYADGILYASGSASEEWMTRAGRLAPALPGVRGLEWEGVDASLALAADVEAIRIEFLPESASLGPQHTAALGQLAELIERLQQVAPGAVTVEIIGRTDRTGDAIFNRRLSENRARAVRAALLARGVEPQLLVARGVGAGDPLPTADSTTRRQVNRSVAFRVITADPRPTSPEQP